MLTSGDRDLSQLPQWLQSGDLQTTPLQQAQGGMEGSGIVGNFPEVIRMWEHLGSVL